MNSSRTAGASECSEGTRMQRMQGMPFTILGVFCFITFANYTREKKFL